MVTQVNIKVLMLLEYFLKNIEALLGIKYLGT